MNVANDITVSPSDYVEAAFLAREVSQNMLDGLNWMVLKPAVIIDAGCGVGETSVLLKKRYPEAQVIALDCSLPMILHGQQTSMDNLDWLCAENTAMPLRHQSVDLIFANFLWPWQRDVKILLREWKRVLRPDGVLLFTALGPDTLQEYRACLGEAIVPHVIDMHDIGDQLLREGFVDPVLEVNHYTVTYRSKEKLLTELYHSGMVIAVKDPTSMDLQPSEEEVWKVTYEIVQAHAFLPANAHSSQTTVDGVTRVPIAGLRKR